MAFDPTRVDVDGGSGNIDGFSVEIDPFWSNETNGRMIMQDKVGQHVPSASQVEKLITELEKLASSTGKFTIALTTEERKHTLKFRPGGEKIVALLGQLVQKHGVSLPGVSVDGMNADLELATVLAPLDVAAAAFAQRVSDTRLEAESECWWAATAFYTALARTAESDPTLAAALKPVIEFFATGRRKKAATAPPTTA